MARLFLLLGDLGKVGDPEMMDSFTLYLHEPGQFWPRWGHPGPPGQGGHGVPGPELHHPPGPRHRGGGHLHHVLHQAAGHDQVASCIFIALRRPCVHKQDYKFTECLRDHIHQTSNCSLPDACSGPAFAAFFDLLAWSQEASLRNLTKSSGCLPKCSYLTYQFMQESRVVAGWHRAWLSSFYLSPSSPSMEEVVESFLYDLSSVVGDLGSYLGLFLGWSILSLAGQLGSLIITQPLFQICL